MIELVEQAKTRFKSTGIELPCSDLLIHIQANEVEDFFTRFMPQEMLTTSVLNPLISSLDWGTDTYVLHSSSVEVNDNKSRQPWEIPKACTRVILLSCYQAHWILFVIELQDKLIKYYNSLESIALPQELATVVRSGLRDYANESIWEFRRMVSALVTSRLFLDRQNRPQLNNRTRTTVVYTLY